MNYEDRTTSVIFGDGGGGVILEPSDDSDLGILDVALYGDGEGRNQLRIDGGGSLNPFNEEVLKGRTHSYRYVCGNMKINSRRATASC